MTNGERYRANPATWLPRVLTRAQAAERGLGADVVDRRLGEGRWVRMAPAVYCTAPPVQPSDLAIAAVAHAGPGAQVSGTAGLALRHFRSVAEFRDVLVLVAATRGPTSVGPIRIRPTPTLPPPDWRDGIPLAPVPRAVADHCLEVRRIDDVRAVVAEAVQRSWCSPHDLADALPNCPRRGSKALRQAVLEIAAGARSAPEARAASIFHSVDLPAFRQNVRLQVGRLHYVADFYFDKLRAIVEIDSEEFHRFRAGWENTLDRDAALQTGDHAVLHVRPTQVTQTGVLLDLVIPWLRTQARARGVPWVWA